MSQKLNHAKTHHVQNRSQFACQGVIKAKPFLLPIADKGTAGSQHICQPFDSLNLTPGRDEATFSRLKEKTCSLNAERSPLLQFSI